MPTVKQRINLTVPAGLSRTLSAAAKRDRTTVATKTLDLVRLALELEEDAALLSVAQAREKNKAKYVSHDAAWL